MVDDRQFHSARKAQKSGSEKRQRVDRFTLRCTQAQHAAIVSGANRAGLSCSAYILAATLQAKPPRAARVPPVEFKALAQVLAQLGRLGSNVNQIARSINYGQNPDLYDLREVPTIIQGLAREVMAALGKGSAARRERQAEPPAAGAA